MHLTRAYFIFVYNFYRLSQSYREFHADLFPETAGSEAPIYASQWMTGTNATVEKILLDPSRWQGKNLHVKTKIALFFSS